MSIKFTENYIAVRHHTYSLFILVNRTRIKNIIMIIHACIVELAIYMAMSALSLPLSTGTMDRLMDEGDIKLYTLCPPAVLDSAGMRKP